MTFKLCQNLACVQNRDAFEHAAVFYTVIYHFPCVLSSYLNVPISPPADLLVCVPFPAGTTRRTHTQERSSILLNVGQTGTS